MSCWRNHEPHIRKVEPAIDKGIVFFVCCIQSQDIVKTVEGCKTSL